MDVPRHFVDVVIDEPAHAMRRDDAAFCPAAQGADARLFSRRKNPAALQAVDVCQRFDTVLGKDAWSLCGLPALPELRCRNRRGC